ncbi:hypothetical protein RDI58_017068 [Solanum bulbocastanum]|uniref:Uncharacterized protein n=1 Tax=Solanum bulbocastanum TaxID=147425 RepID=A0AAN8T940_SOLBU
MSLFENLQKKMANARIARFVTEVAPPQFVNVMRNRASKMLETIKEEEREASTSESLSLKSYSPSSSSAYSASSSNSLPKPTKKMANARIARFVTEVAPPQFVNVMRHQASKMLETIKEEEREAITSEALSLKSSSLSSSSTYSALSSNAKNSKVFLKEVQRSLSAFGS